MEWRGGQVYQVRFTTDLNLPFQPMQTVIAAADGEARFALSTAGFQGFYLLAEIAP